MLLEDRFYIGAIAAILVSCLAFFVVTLINEALTGTMIGSYFYRGISREFEMMLGVVANLLPFRIYNNKEYTNAMRGVGLVTLLEGFGVVIFMFA